jgi:hypothetical protein
MTMHDPDQELEQFLDELATHLARYQTARINLITLSQRRSPTPTVRTWAAHIDKLRAEQYATRDLILAYARQPEENERARINEHNRLQREFENSALSQVPES